MDVTTSEQNPNLKLAQELPQDDVAQQIDARAIGEGSKFLESEHPPKKRKTRRGKSKRRQPYVKNSGKTNKLIKPEAPHNSNQFLLEDHGLIEELDENLKVSPSTLRTRESSFSIDSEGEFYSSPDDEEQFLIKDFDDQYESLHAERLQAMTKTELIDECLMLENKLDQVSKRFQKTEDDVGEDSRPDLKEEVERLTIENERLRRENDMLRSNVDSSEDSESNFTTHSTSSCNSTSCSSRSRSPITTTDYSKTNGHLLSPKAEIV